MKKAIILILLILGALIFLCNPVTGYSNQKLQEILSAAEDKDVIIIFNSGGWGDTPFEKADDFAPVIKEVQGNLSEWGYDSVVIPYQRTKTGFFGRLAGMKDFLSGFNYSSENLSKTVEFISENMPDKKIVVAGLSSGGGLTSETMEKIPKENRSVFAIAAGAPFFTKHSNANTLLLTNEGEDILSKDDFKLFFYAVRAPFRWLAMNISGERISLAQCFDVPGHKYYWSSKEVNSQITSFLAKELK